MNNEQLQAIKTLSENSYFKGFPGDGTSFDFSGEVRRLVEQAERYEEARKDAMELYKQNKRYREALEFYASEDIYEWHTYYNPQQQLDCMVIDDGGHKARQALGDSDDN